MTARIKSPDQVNRGDFAYIDYDDISTPMNIYSYGFPKWRLTDIIGQPVDETLPKIGKNMLAQMSEKDIPKKAIITYQRRPRWILEEVS